MNGRPGNSPVSALLPIYLRCDWIDLLSFMQLTGDCSRVHDVWYNYFFFSLKSNSKMDGEQVFDIILLLCNYVIDQNKIEVKIFIF